MGTLDARTFWKQFKEKICDPNGVIPGSNIPYRKIYTKNKRYTKLINKQLVPEILKNLDNKIEITNEYYRFDVAGWKQLNDPNEELEKQFNEANFNYHAWKLEVAFEHENDSCDWSDEVIKLLYANCPLKIVVGYNDSLKRDDDIYGDKYKLDLLAKVISNLKVDMMCEYLIIIGNGNKDGYINKVGEEYFGYRAYLYDNDKNAFDNLDEIK